MSNSSVWGASVSSLDFSRIHPCKQEQENNWKGEIISNYVEQPLFRMTGFFMWDSSSVGVIWRLQLKQQKMEINIRLHSRIVVTRS